MRDLKDESVLLLSAIHNDGGKREVRSLLATRESSLMMALLTLNENPPPEPQQGSIIPQ